MRKLDVPHPAVTYPFCREPSEIRATLLRHNRACCGFDLTKSLIGRIGFSDDEIGVNRHWGSIVPRESEPGVYPVVSTWYTYLKAEPAAFFAYLYVAEIALRIKRLGLNGFSTSLPVSLELKGKALSYLQKCIDNLKGPAPDVVHSVILSLGAHEPNYDILVKDHSQSVAPSPSPMAKTQSLDTVSYMSPQPSHMQALYQLVPERGGLQNIKTFGIADTLAL